MSSTVIKDIKVHDARFPLTGGDGADSLHHDPIYAYATTELVTDNGMSGTGLAFALGQGSGLICAAIPPLAEALRGREIEELMSDFGNVFRSMADDQYLRWVGPHKGVVHLALASITNACFDLWAKSRGVPLWKLLLDLSPDEVIGTLDLKYLEDVLTPDEAREMIASKLDSRHEREGILETGYPGYDTSFGWLKYSDDRLRDNAREAMGKGFNAIKLKVGSPDSDRDVRRAFITRETVGDSVRIMLDVNQIWTLPQAIRVGRELLGMNPYWLEEPTHPDDVLAHQKLVEELSPPCNIAVGEHIPHRVLFKNFMQARAIDIVQVDATRVGGVSELITVSLLAKKFGLPVVPHVGDMGQIHQHTVFFNHIALDLEPLFLEYIPHLREHFVHPANIDGGVYRPVQIPGSSSDLKMQLT